MKKETHDELKLRLQEYEWQSYDDYEVRIERFVADMPLVDCGSAGKDVAEYSH
jgi:hypothetical protein